MKSSEASVKLNGSLLQVPNSSGTDVSQATSSKSFGSMDSTFLTTSKDNVKVVIWVWPLNESEQCKCN
mgnify:CR=1 FL=1